jgi:hypothetical protein
MADKGTWDLNDHRRFAHQFLPPGEFRDGYLGHLDEIELKEPAEETGEAGLKGPAPGSTAAETRRGAHGAAGEGRGWDLQRVVVVAAGSVAFAYGTWVLTSLL